MWRWSGLSSRPIDINLHSIKNVKSPVNRFDAVNKAYADHIKYKTAIGNIPNTVMTDHTVITFSHCESFCQWKDNNMWDVGWTVGRWVDCSIKSNVRNCVAWPSQVFQGSSLMTFFTGSPASGWTHTSRLDYIELPWVSLNNFNRNI